LAKKPSRTALLKEIKRVAKISPESEITRDFFRVQSNLKDAWNLYWPNFAAFVMAAGVKKIKEAPVESVKTAPVPKPELTPEMQLDLAKEKLKAKQSSTDEQLKFATERIVQLESELDAVISIGQKTPQVTIITPKVASGSSESVAVFVASDWHIEEQVDSGSVGYKNEFNLEIADFRIQKFFQGSFRLFDILRRDTTIKTIILALLGDFITNTIHPDFQETNNLLPAEAIYLAECKIVSGIKFLLEQTPPDTEFLIVAHSGNHGRMTAKQRGSAEAGNSLEHYMYYHIRDFFKGEPRIKFQIAEGYHSFVRLFNEKYTMRFHHGHAMRFQGGVGGLYIPVLKAINQWNKAQWADLDVFGHFHTFTNAGNFISNGSLIGYNDFAVRIKAEYEKPQQAFLLISRKWNAKTMTSPVFLD
jgi:hypothetical protein